MVEFVVRGIALEKESQMPLALLKEKEGEKILPLWLGPSEASAIIVEMEGVQPPRLLTHDLLAHLFTKHRYKVTSMEIYGEVDERFLARLHYRKGLRKYSVDVRPSDGLALAIRLGAPILGDPVLLKTVPSGVSEETTLGSSEILFLEPDYREKPWV